MQSASTIAERSNTVFSPVPAPRLKADGMTRWVHGYQATDSYSSLPPEWATTTPEYAQRQMLDNARITREFLIPILQRLRSRSVVDIGCGVGESVHTLLGEGYDAYGVDLACLAPMWENLGRSPGQFFVVEPDRHILPFESDSVDFAFSFGVIEHIGTSDGHTTRRDDYHARRAYWLREIFRIIRPGGYMLIGGPNRGFPLDFSHALDAAAGRLERLLSKATGVSVHRTWGEYFLWGYDDFPRYLAGLRYRVHPVSIRNLLRFSRVPTGMRSLARLYVDHLPAPLRGTGLNPWVMALVEKSSSDMTAAAHSAV